MKSAPTTDSSSSVTRIEPPLILQFLSDHMSLKSDDMTEINGKKYLINESVVNQILVLEREKTSIIIKPVLCYYDFYDTKQFELYEKKIKEKKIDWVYCQNKIIVLTETQENKRKMESKRNAKQGRRSQAGSYRDI